MDNNGMFGGPEGVQLRRALMVGAWVLVALLVLCVVFVASSLRYVGQGITPADTIAVDGEGQYLAVPDVATFTYSVMATESTVAAAQASATQKANAVTSYLTGAGVSSSDIQTTDYSIDPQYEYQNASCPPTPLTASGGSVSVGVYCAPQKQILTGYQVSQTTTVTVEDLSQAGTLLAGVGNEGATEISGLTFTFKDPNAPLAQARALAIADAKTKAQALAQELGVTLGPVVNFTESGSGQEPMPYAMAATASGAVSSAPTISPGQNMVTDDVTITYEIQ